MVLHGIAWFCRVLHGMQYNAIPCNTLQNHAIPCNTMQYHATLITADGAYHCPVGSIMAIFILLPNCPLYYLGAKLSGAKLSGAKLSGAKLSYNQNQVPYFSGNVAFFE